MQKLFFDFFPILLFFLVFKFYPDFVSADAAFCILGGCIPGGKDGAIYAATAVAIVSSFFQVAWYWKKHHRFEKSHLIALGILVVLGGATLMFQNEAFIKWKPTVVNWLFGAVFLATQFIGKKTLVQRMMEKSIELDSPEIWKTLNLSWAGFFIVMGLVNIYVAFNFSTDTWVNFKMFGMLGLTLIFVLGQSVYLSRHMPDEQTAQDGKEP